MFLKHPVLSVLTLGYLGLVGWITLGPQPLDSRGDAWLWSLLRFFGRHDATSWLTYQRVEFLANVAMFVPVGMFLLLLLGRRLWFVSVLLGVALTAAIEFAQLFIPGRVSDYRDIIANSLGAILGVLIALVVTMTSRVKTQRLRTRSRA